MIWISLALWAASGAVASWAYVRWSFARGTVGGETVPLAVVAAFFGPLSAVPVLALASMEQKRQRDRKVAEDLKRYEEKESAATSTTQSAAGHVVVGEEFGVRRTIMDLVMLSKLARSRAEARRAVTHGVVTVNGHRIVSAESHVPITDLIGGTMLIVNVVDQYCILTFDKAIGRFEPRSLTDMHL